jgi:hypothetical protein
LCYIYVNLNLIVCIIYITDFDIWAAASLTHSKRCIMILIL